MFANSFLGPFQFLFDFPVHGGYTERFLSLFPPELRVSLKSLFDEDKEISIGEFFRRFSDPYDIYLDNALLKAIESVIWFHRPNTQIIKGDIIDVFSLPPNATDGIIKRAHEHILSSELPVFYGVLEGFRLVMEKIIKEEMVSGDSFFVYTCYSERILVSKMCGCYNICFIRDSDGYVYSDCGRSIAGVVAA